MTENKKDTSLNKFISQTGFCSRRQADQLIKEKRVLVNDRIPVSGNRVTPQDEIKIDGQVLIASPQIVYMAFNKPRGISCTTDTKDKHNIIDFINYPGRIFPIGRLDKSSEGLIFLTNDGDIVNKILRAGNNHQKEYIVTVDKALTPEFIKRMANGVPILNTITKKCLVTKKSQFVFRIILTQGLNRQIRRMCEALNYHVIKLVRIRIMSITLQGIPPGKWRYFTPEEISGINALLANSVKTEEASL